MNKTAIYFSMLSLLIFSCSRYDELMKNGKESKAGASESHNSGLNCASCHNKQGISEAKLEGGWWNISGTIYSGAGTTASASDGTVELWSGPNRTGTLVKKMEIDNLGNIFTAKVVALGGGVFPVLVNKNGQVVKKMNESTANGSCNSCHGNTTPRISFP